MCNKFPARFSTNLQTEKKCYSTVQAHVMIFTRLISKRLQWNRMTIECRTKALWVKHTLPFGHAHINCAWCWQAEIKLSLIQLPQTLPRKSFLIHSLTRCQRQGDVRSGLTNPQTRVVLPSLISGRSLTQANSGKVSCKNRAATVYPASVRGLWRGWQST